VFGALTALMWDGALSVAKGSMSGGTIAALVMGLWSMVYGHGETGPYDEEHWMTYRIILQAIAVAALVATFFVGG